MRANKKLTITFITFAFAFVSLIGSTYAWYVINNTASAQVGGTTIKYDDMVVGIKSSNQEIKNENYHYDQELGAYVPNEGFNIDGDFVESIYQDEGFCQEGIIAPITSGSFYESTGDLTLYDRVSTAHVDHTVLADKDDYFEFTLVFKTVGAFKEIYFNDALMDFTGSDDSVLKSMRIGITSNGKSTIYDPSLYDSSISETKVGGLMDLNGDGVYDYNSKYVSNKYVYEEIYYGEADGEVSSRLIDDEDELAVPVPGSNLDALAYDKIKHPTVKYKNPSVTYETYTKDGTAKVQQARGLLYYTYSIADEERKPLGISDENGICEIKFTFWLEGWDKDCMYYLMNRTFGATLGFEVVNQDTNYVE